MAMMTCVSTPVLAVAHGVTHAHLASAHGSSSAHGGADDDADDHAEDHADDHADDHAHANEQGLPAATAADAAVNTSLRGPELELPTHEHQHDHLSLGNASIGRDLFRLDCGAQLIDVPSMLSAHALTLVTQFGRSTWRDRSLLARPGPATGPPPNPRAPPVR